MPTSLFNWPMRQVLKITRAALQFSYSHHCQAAHYYFLRFNDPRYGREQYRSQARFNYHKAASFQMLVLIEGLDKSLQPAGLS